MTSFDKLRAWTSELTGYFIYLLFSATLGPFLFGYHLAELNAPQDVITCAKKSITSSPVKTSSLLNLPQCIPMDTFQIGLVSSIFTLGGLVGALFAGPLSSKHGRLSVMRGTTIFFTVGPIAEALAANIPIMAIGRFLSGIGAGAAIVIVPIYISEIAPPKERGFFGAFSQIMTNTGIMTAQILGYFLSHGSAWRWILAVAGMVGLLQMAGLTFAVDSPRWRADHGYASGALADLKRIRGPGADLRQETAGWDVSRVSDDSDNDDGERATLLFREDTTANNNNNNNNNDTISAAGDEASPNKKQDISILQCLTTAPYARATFAVIVVMVAQQFTGINSIVMYGVNLLSDLLQANSALLNILVSVLNVVITVAAAPLADILGRKPCLLASISVMGVSSLLLGIGIRGSIKLLSAVSVLTFVGGFSIGLGPVPFILASELLNPEAVGAAQSCALAANWISTFVVAQFFPVVNQALGKGVVYFGFAILAVVFAAAVGAFVPESKGKKDADEVWGRPSRRED